MIAYKISDVAALFHAIKPSQLHERIYVVNFIRSKLRDRLDNATRHSVIRINSQDIALCRSLENGEWERYSVDEIELEMISAISTERPGKFACNVIFQNTDLLIAHILARWQCCSDSDTFTKLTGSLSFPPSVVPSTRRFYYWQKLQISLTNKLENTLGNALNTLKNQFKRKNKMANSQQKSQTSSNKKRTHDELTGTSESDTSTEGTTSATGNPRAAVVPPSTTGSNIASSSNGHTQTRSRSSTIESVLSNLEEEDDDDSLPSRRSSLSSIVVHANHTSSTSASTILHNNQGMSVQFIHV
jgi:hypothetical protein